MPDGCVDLMWQTDRGAFFAGPDTEPIPTATPPGAILLRARFRPGAGGPALGVPLAALLNQRVDLVNQRVDLADLRPDLADRLPARFDPDQAGPALIEVCAQMLAAAPPDPLVAAGARMLANPRVRVGELAEELGVSDRQLRRRFGLAHQSNAVDELFTLAEEPPAAFQQCRAAGASWRGCHRRQEAPISRCWLLMLSTPASLTSPGQTAVPFRLTTCGISSAASPQRTR